MSGKTPILTISLLLLLSTLGPGAAAAPDDMMMASYTAAGVAVDDVEAHGGCLVGFLCPGSPVFRLPNGTTFVVVSVVDSVFGTAPFEACLIGIDGSVACSGVQCVPAIGFGAGESKTLIVYVYALHVRSDANDVCAGSTGTVSVTTGTS